MDMSIFLTDADNGNVAVLYAGFRKGFLFEIGNDVSVVRQFAHFTHLVLVRVNHHDVRARGGKFAGKRRAEPSHADYAVRYFSAFGMMKHIVYLPLSY